jgi:preprotein translocase subunit SecD
MSARDERRSARGGWRLPIAAALMLAAIGVVALGFVPWMQGSTTALAAVRFEARLAEEQPVPGLIVAQIGNSGRLIYLHPEIVVSNDDISESSIVDEGGGRVSIALRFEPEGAERLRQATQAHIGKPMALLIDGRVVMAPTLRGAISDSAMITGVYTKAEAQRVVEGIGSR